MDPAVLIAFALVAVGLLFLWLRIGSVPDARYETIDGDELARRLDAGQTKVVDVREPYEYEAGHIPGAVNIPLSRFGAVATMLQPTDHIVLVCAHGMRSRRAASALADRDFVHLAELRRGMSAWRGPILRG